ncbi:unnamed protein product [Psylliodes chrysocephalus]|uniref:HTH psq-type domain-containing protein n=1 Tax=Psylliodes chrysocephalus TaxID=3402493 RepID=A0A9P0CD54_9CUCU|nr:unnamed protein product [Psylliodes chrysocephala]
MYIIFSEILVKTYIRITTRQGWDPNSMRLSLEYISKGMPFERAARLYNLPLSTLKRRAKNQNKLVSVTKLDCFISNLSICSFKMYLRRERSANHRTFFSG